MILSVPAVDLKLETNHGNSVASLAVTNGEHLEINPSLIMTLRLH